VAAATSYKSSKSHELDVTAVLLRPAGRFREFPQYMCSAWKPSTLFVDFLNNPRSLQVMSDHNLRNICIKPSIQIILQLDAIYF